MAKCEVFGDSKLLSKAILRSAFLNHSAKSNKRKSCRLMIHILFC